MKKGFLIVGLILITILLLGVEEQETEQVGRLHVLGHITPGTHVIDIGAYNGSCSLASALLGATLDGADLAGAIFNDATICPDGQTHADTPRCGL